MSFVDRNQCWSAEQREAAHRLVASIKEHRLEVVRFSFADQHGVLRGKVIVASEVENALKNGVAITTTLLAKDVSHRTAFPVFTPGGGFGMREMEGGADFLMIADPTTFRVLPWAMHTGWVLCDLYFRDGQPVPFSTRQLYRGVIAQAAAQGYELVAGLEVEFHVFRIADPRLQPADAGQPGEPPEVELLTRGYQYLTELRFDQVDPLLQCLRANLLELGLPLRSLEIEMGPSQLEFTFAPLTGLEAADAMILFRSAVKQICHRQGYHATFMCRPRLPNAVSSGWHLHQSLRSTQDEGNVFIAASATPPLSPVGMSYAAGLLEHARAAVALATPTINGYKRYRPYSLAPDRVGWGQDNRGTMLRVVAGFDDAASRIENRIGEPAANPYLYLGSQLLCGLDGIRHGRDPGPASDTPYENLGELLPRTLGEALGHLRSNDCLRAGFGSAFVDYFIRLKEAELARFNLEVTEWEHREYFDML